MKKRIISSLTILIMSISLVLNDAVLSKAEVSSLPNDSDKIEVVKDFKQETLYYNGELSSKGFQTVSNGRYDEEYELPSKGDVTNLVIYIKFKGQNTETVYDAYDGNSIRTVKPYANGTIQEISDAFNGDKYSLKGYSTEVSGNQFKITSDFYPKDTLGNVITYVDSYDLGYYLPYNSITNLIGYQLNEGDNRKAELMLNAINYVGMQIVDKGKFDINKDGIIDYCTFVVPNMSTWSDLLWPTCSTFLRPITIPNMDNLAVRKTLFITTPYFRYYSKTSAMYKCLSHESMHMIGFEDQYDPSGSSSLLSGDWTVMSNNIGHPTVYEKLKYGKWLYTVPEASINGNYILSSTVTNPLTNTIGYKISIQGSDEYYMLEYRDRANSIYESEIPSSGLLVYKVNPKAFGNMEGEPYEINVVRASTDYYADYAPLNANNTNYDVSLTGTSGTVNFNIKYLSLIDGKLTFSVTRENVAIPPSELKLLSVIPNIPSPQENGQAIQITASSIGGVGINTYKFLVEDSYGKVTYTQNYSTSNTLNWNPTDESSYKISVSVKDGNGTIKTGILYYVISNVQIRTFTTNIISPQSIGTTIKLEASGVGAGILKYRISSIIGNKITVLKDFSTINYVTWNPDTVGNYTLIAEIKDETGKVINKKLSYIIKYPLKITSFKSSFTSPQKVGTGIILSATGIGNGTLKYRFCVNDGTKLNVLQDFGTNSSVKWTPTKAGTYIISVGMTDASGQKIYTKFLYTIKNELKITSFKANITSPQKVGTGITLSATGTGNGTLKYRFCVNDGIKLKVLQDFGAGSSVIWTPNKEGTYIVSVGITDGSGGKKYTKFVYIIQ